VKIVVIAAVLSFAATGVQAQTIYRHVNLAGGITYTDQSEAAQPPASETAPVEEEAKTSARRPYIPPRLAATVNASEAARRLQQAQLKRKQGMAPQPGEQVVGAGALNRRYWQRQEKLRLAVEQAQHRLNATQRPLVFGSIR